MVKKIYLEEICNRETLKSFIDRFHRLSGLWVFPFNERGELLVGEVDKILPGMTDASELVHYPTSEMLERPDGSFVRLVKLEYRACFFCAVMIGPFIKEGCEYTGDEKLPVVNSEILSGAVDSINSFFMQMVDLAYEKQELARKEKILSILEEASTKMNSALEFKHLVNLMLDVAIEITGATNGAILLRKDEEPNLLEVVIAKGGRFPHEVKKMTVQVGKGICGTVVETKKAMNVPNVLLEPIYIESPENIYSELAVPLFIKDEVIGVAVVDSTEIDAFTKNDIASLNTLSSMVTQVIENSRLLSESDQKVKELSKVFSISEVLSVRSLDHDGYVNVLKEVCEATGTTAASFMVFASDSEHLFMHSFYGLPEELDNITIPLGKGYQGWVAQHRKPLLVNDVQHDNTIVYSNFLDQYAKSLLIVPLVTMNDRFLGTLSVYQTDEQQYIDSAKQDLLNTIGRLITSHMENERLFHDSKRKLDYLATLNKVGSSVSKTLNISRLFDTILQQVQEVVNVENCSFMAFDKTSQTLSLDAAIGLPSDVVGKVCVKLGEGVAGWVAKNKQHVLLRDVSKDARFANRQVARSDYKTRSVLSVPILHDNELLGVLNVNNKRSGEAFFEEDLNLLLGISGQISQAIANARLHEKTDMQVAELSLIQELGKAINSSLDLDSVLNYFIDMTSRITDSVHTSLMLYDEETNELYVEVHRGFEDQSIKDFRMKVGEGIGGTVALTRRSMKVDNTKYSAEYKKLWSYGREEELTFICAPLLNKDNLIGIINCERPYKIKGPFTYDNLDLLETLASQASIAIENAKLYHNLLNVYLETIRSLAAAIDAKDSYTHGHSRRVTDLSVGLALEMKLPKKEVDIIRHASLLHDVGKIGISEQILRKPGKLNDEEFEAIKSHPNIGAGILSSIEFLKDVCEIIKHHHERYDGRGYPDGLKGEEIPLGARIVTVADSFDAITSKRPYRKPLTLDEATAEVIRCSGNQFDPEVVKAFVSLRTSENCPPWFKGEYLDQSLADKYPLQL